MLERTISQCLAPEPDDRFARGSDLAEQLDGCRRVRGIERKLPPLPKYMASVLRHPFMWLIALHMLPQMVASFVNYLYNFTQVVHTEVSEYHGLYVKIAIVYNSIIYVTAISLIVISVRPVLKCWRALASSEPVSDEQVAIARQKRCASQSGSPRSLPALGTSAACLYRPSFTSSSAIPKATCSISCWPIAYAD